MGISTYKKKIEAYVKEKQGARPKAGEESKGLLSPKPTMERSSNKPTEQNALASVGDFVHALREKRQEFKLKKGAK